MTKSIIQYFSAALTAIAAVSLLTSTGPSAAEQLPWGPTSPPELVTPDNRNAPQLGRQAQGTYANQPYGAPQQGYGAAAQGGYNQPYGNQPSAGQYAAPARPPATGYGTQPGDRFSAANSPGGRPSYLPPSRYTEPGRPYTPQANQPRYYTAQPPNANAPPGYYDNRRPGPAPPPNDGTYSQDEIANAGHRFFGKLTTGLAKIIERAFARSGRPNGYILGEEAGGALVAGLVYGEGTLRTKNAGDHKVYWQGPSIGYDFGANGSKTMILVYNMRDVGDIYHRYSGVSGSAYLVGGAGITLQKRGRVTLAPIRTGLGLRIGANLGYLKYSRRPTWNPF